MAKESNVSKAIYKQNTKLCRYLNDVWIFTELLRPELNKWINSFQSSESEEKKLFPVPKSSGIFIGKRCDNDIGQIFSTQYQRGIFETNVVSMVSRMEAFIQDSIAIVVCAFPEKLAILSDKSGIPLDLFLEHENREDVISRFVHLKCEGLMFGKPSDYLDKASKVLAIELDSETVQDFIEIKASRDIIIHSNGLINKLYCEKAGVKRRGNVGQELAIDHAYFRHVIVTFKKLAASIQKKTEAVYK